MINFDERYWVILVRHGVDDPQTGDLTDFAKILIGELSENIRNYINIDNEVVVISSPVKRATQSAELIAEKLSVDTVTKHDCLSYENFILSDVLKIITTLNGKKCLIIVTHQPVIEKVYKELRGKEIYMNISKSSAVINNLKKDNGVFCFSNDMNVELR